LRFEREFGSCAYASIDFSCEIAERNERGVKGVQNLIHQNPKKLTSVWLIFFFSLWIDAKRKTAGVYASGFNVWRIFRMRLR
jgi:hypothetical protein